MPESSRKHFLFVTFNDPLVVGVLHFLASAICPRSRFSAHITIQGPFSEKVATDKVDRVKKLLDEDAFFIGNPGLWGTPKGAALFLKVHHKNLPQVWDKPDFPREKYGMNPHVTLYDGANTRLAHRALEFLKSHRIELICRDFELIQYVPKQLDLFPMEGVSPDENALSRLASLGRIDSSFRAKFLAHIRDFH